MIKGIKYLFLPIALVISFKMLAQNGHEPILFFQLEQASGNYPMLNPASLSSQEGFQINVGNQSSGGPFRNIRSYYLSSSYGLNLNKKIGTKGAVGINFSGEKEGELLNRNRFDIAYSLKTNLAEETSIAAGLALGIFNYLVISTPISPGGSSTALDGHLGFWLEHKNAYAGISANRIFESTLSPIDQIYSLDRYYHLILGSHSTLSPNLTLSYSGIARWMSGLKNFYDLGIKGVYKDISQGVRLRTGKSIVIITGIENLKIDRIAFDAIFSYSIPIADQSPDIRIFGIDLKLKLKNKE